MSPVFDLPHIFIVFQPGAGGNFVAGIISKLFNSDSSELHIANNGSSHTTIDRKIAGTDYLSFGTLFDDQLRFPSQEKRLAYYLKNIEKLEITTPQVIWSHDFTNIPLYQKFFPNSKTLVITQNSNLEKLVAIFMNVTKNLVDPTHTPPFPPEQWIHVNKHLDYILETGLSTVGDRCKYIVKNKFDISYQNIVKFVHIKQMLKVYGVLHLVDNTFSETKDLTNVVSFWTPGDSTTLEHTGINYDSYINKNCKQLPYSYLIEGRCDLLIDAIEYLVTDLNANKCAFIKMQFTKYRDAQDQLMLTNPYEYYSDLEKLSDRDLRAFLKDSNAKM